MRRNFNRSHIRSLSPPHSFVDTDYQFAAQTIMPSASTSWNGLGIIVSWRDRPELARTLPFLASCACRHAGSVTVVNYGGDSGDLTSLLPPDVDLPIRVVTVHEQHWFNKSKAQNIGAAHSPHDLLFFCDCDILLNVDSIDDLVVQVRSDTATFGTIAEVSETERNARGAGNVVVFGYHLKLRLANGRTLDIIDNEEDADTGTRQAPGLVMTHRSSFERIGGYNARLHGWGWEDQDMIARLTLGEGLKRIQRGAVKHISHGDDSRIRYYPPVKDRWESRDRMFRQALANYDRGDFSGTFATDIIELSGCSDVTPHTRT
jgi:hypothetical protein